jgi:hypothetical protein
MAKAFKGGQCRVMQFLKSPKGGVNCVWFRTAGFPGSGWGRLRQKIFQIHPYFFPLKYAYTNEGTNAFAYETG